MKKMALALIFMTLAGAVIFYVLTIPGRLDQVQLQAMSEGDAVRGERRPGHPARRPPGDPILARCGQRPPGPGARCRALRPVRRAARSLPGLPSGRGRHSGGLRVGLPGPAEPLNKPQFPRLRPPDGRAIHRRFFSGPCGRGGIGRRVRFRSW